MMTSHGATFDFVLLYMPFYCGLLIVSFLSLLHYLFFHMHTHMHSYKCKHIHTITIVAGTKLHLHNNIENRSTQTRRFWCSRPTKRNSFNQHCSQTQNVTVWLHSALFIEMSASQKLIYVNCSNQFCVVIKCFMQVVYNEKFEVDISHISVFNKICKKIYFCVCLLHF